MRILHHTIRIEELLYAEPVAARAGAARVIEREQSWFKLGQAVSTHVAGEAVGERDLVRIGVIHLNDTCDAIGQSQRGLEGFRQSQMQVFLDPEPIDYGVDVVFPAQIEPGRLVQLVYLAVDPRADKALRLEVGHQLDVLALAFGDNRRDEHKLRAFGQFEDVIDHLADGLGFQCSAVVGALGRAGARIQQAQVVVNFGYRADGRPWVVRGRLLLDRYRRGQTIDVIDVRLFHHRQELACVCR